MGKIFLALCGPSASWKTTIAEMIKENNWFITPTHFTTRARRPWEENSTHYQYISEEEFIEKTKNWDISIFTVVSWNLYWYSEKEANWEKVIFIIEPKWVAHLERYCIENKIKLISILIDVDEETRKKRFMKRDGSLDEFYRRIDVDNYITRAWKKYCDNILPSKWWPQKMYKKITKVIQAEVNWSITHKIKKIITRAKHDIKWLFIGKSLKIK